MGTGFFGAGFLGAALAGVDFLGVALPCGFSVTIPSWVWFLGRSLIFFLGLVLGRSFLVVFLRALFFLVLIFGGFMYLVFLGEMFFLGLDLTGP